MVCCLRKGGGVMSMLSAQADRLRDKARLFEGYQNGEISSELREAADTIISLRDRLQAAELWSVTCEPKWTLQGKTQTQEFWRCECGNCGYEFGVEDRQSSPWHVVVGSVDVPNFCPECGVKQKAVER